jgi:hypothetical protein
MSGFDLLNNYTSNSEALRRKNRSHTSSSSATMPVVESFTPYHPLLSPWPSHFVTTPPTIAIGPASGTGNFEVQTGLITMVQASQFSGLPSEDASAHLQHFLELCDTIIIKDVAPASTRLRLFPFSLLIKVK